MINEYGLDSNTPEWKQYSQEVGQLINQLNKDRDKAHQMLEQAEKDNPQTFKLAIKIYTIFRKHLEDPDPVIDPLTIIELLKKG